MPSVSRNFLCCVHFHSFNTSRTNGPTAENTETMQARYGKTQVRVSKIESIRDLDGNLGKRIELIEDRQIPRFMIKPQSEEAQVVQDVLQALQQQMPIFSGRTDLAVPKIILFLTEQEYESLGITFDVNQAYEISLENQSIRFTKIA